MNRGRVPCSTYRLQFGRQLSFSQVKAQLPYLQALGITDLYVSPLLQARKKSSHGYDVTNPQCLNPELGTPASFQALSKKLQEKEIGLLLDIVPNHMAASTENKWWRDVLQNGSSSPFQNYFAIDWNPPRPGLKHKVLLPVLGDYYSNVLENQELQLHLEKDGLWVYYYELRFPLQPAACEQVLTYRLKALTENHGVDHPAVRKLVELAGRLKNHETAKMDLAPTWEQLWQLYHSHTFMKTFLDKNIENINSGQSLEMLDRLLSQQHYRLAFWRSAHLELNYRRFFDISDLVAMRVEKEEVFQALHAFIFDLVRSGQVTGLRVDHIDGLYDPRTYLERLQHRLGEKETYIVVEKILSGDEELPEDWPVAGTTGYDFLKVLNGIFVDRSGAALLDKIYNRFSSRSGADFTEVVYSQKKRVIKELFAGEIRSLAVQAGNLAGQDRLGCDLTLAELEETLTELTACFPVYRTYIQSFPIFSRDRFYLEKAFPETISRRPALRQAVRFFRRVLLLEYPASLPETKQKEWLDFVRRWQQFTGPIMAKGFEDTALYVYNRLISLNEVGGEPGITGTDVKDLHRFQQQRLQKWPHTMNTTSSHDTKRSEDVRARINVLSEITQTWAEHLEKWCSWNRPASPVNINGKPVPDGNTELLLYQTLLGAWPLMDKELPSFKERIKDFMIKAAREAKVFTSWLYPDAGYEKALTDYVLTILEPSKANRFLEDFQQFQKHIAYYGALNSLAQLLLKITSPGVPDIYQGMELWNFSLVDPDNRRKVDFDRRKQLLEILQKKEAEGKIALIRELFQTWETGNIKLYLTYKALNFRKNNRNLFAYGEYIPSAAAGPSAEHACAFLRHHRENKWVLVAVPRLPARLHSKSQLPPTTSSLVQALGKESALLLPPDSPECWQNIFTGETINSSEASSCPDIKEAARLAPRDRIIPLGRLFANFPAALLQNQHC